MYTRRAGCVGVGKMFSSFRCSRLHTRKLSYSISLLKMVVLAYHCILHSPSYTQYAPQCMYMIYVPLKVCNIFAM